MTKRKYFGAAPYATWDACLTLAQPWLDAVHFGQVIRVDAGEFLFHEGEIHGYFYLLRSGLVSSKVLRRSGSEILLEVFGPGAIFGEGPAFSEISRPTTTRAETPCVLSRYHPSEVSKHFQESPGFATSLLRILGFKNQIVVGKMSFMTSRNPTERVVDLILRIGKASRLESANGGSSPMVEISVSHETIAEMTALTRVSVTRALTDLERGGAIPAKSKQKFMVDLRRLEEILTKE